MARLTDAQIKHMTERFLNWRLPDNFSPDAGISFTPTFNDSPAVMATLGLTEPMRHEPTGTNLFDYSQAKAMILHMIEDLPGNAFEATGTINFGDALVALKEGKKVARAGWNGKGMFLYHVPAASYPASRNGRGTMIGYFEDDMVPYRDYIAMKTAQGDVVPWVCSQSDALEEDWQIVA